MRHALLASVATSALALFGAAPAQAQTDTPAIMALMQRTTQGFSQLSNYLKGQVAADQQNEDASNTAIARFHRDVRSAQIRDEHVVTPAACEALDARQSISVAAGQSWVVSASLARVTDVRGEGGPGMPAWHGQAQAQAANAELHHARYCSEAEAQDGVCSLTARPNWDQRASTLMGVLSYGEAQENVSAANDYASTLLQPVPLRALRGDELRSVQGQEVQTWRRWYNAMKSQARLVASDIIAGRTNSVTLTPAQRAQQQALGLEVTPRASWAQVVDLEVNRYASRPWAAALERMPPASVQREKAKLLALNTYVAWQQYRMTEHNAMLLAALVADRAEDATGRPKEALRHLVTMPSPTMR